MAWHSPTKFNGPRRKGARSRPIQNLMAQDKRQVENENRIRHITIDELDRFKGLRTPELIEKFWSRTSVDEKTGCWIYPFTRVYFHDIQTQPRRVIYALTGGPIPTDKKVSTICQHPRCINPYHLWLDNVHRGVRANQESGQSVQSVTEVQE